MRGYVTGYDYDALASLPDLAYERWLQDRDEPGRVAWDRDKAFFRRLALLQSFNAQLVHEALNEENR